MNDPESLHRQAQLIRASGILGRSRLIRLFNFLVECSSDAVAPKEAIIAMDVFDKNIGFDVAQDSTVRVYIHNLRRKLDQYYSGLGKDEPVRLMLPRGEYRLAVVPRTAELIEPESVPQGKPQRTGRIVGAATGLVILVCLLAVGFAFLSRPHTAWESVRHSPIWSQLLQNGKPIVVVLGDYYIFGDTQQTSDVQRLIREFSINSKDDLEQYLQVHPDLAEHYMDVGLQYLPTSSAFALSDIMPILAVTDTRRVRVVLMSSLDPGIIKSANIVYIGLLSGLGALQKVAFAGSRFQIGASFDELIDQKTHHHYFSGAPQYRGEISRSGADVGYHDYGFFATFAGLEGNQIVIIASMQDEGLRQLADMLTKRSRLDELYKQFPGSSDFDALFDVLSMDNMNLNGKLLVASPLNPTKIWTAQ